MTIAILAHDSRKELALQFCTAYSGILSRNPVIATGTLPASIRDACATPIEYNGTLILDGLYSIWKRNVKK